MPSADDGTQRRIFQRLDERGVSRVEVASWLGVSEQVVSDYASIRRTLPPWALVRLAKRLGDAEPIVGEVVRAADQEIQRRPPGELERNLLDAVLDLYGLVGELGDAVRDSAAPESAGGREKTAEERRLIQAKVHRVRELLAQFDRNCDVPLAPVRVAS